MGNRLTQKTFHLISRQGQFQEKETFLLCKPKEKKKTLFSIHIRSIDEKGIGINRKVYKIMTRNLCKRKVARFSFLPL